LAVAALQRLMASDGHQEAVGWLLIEELLPRPDNALLDIDGRPHVSELLVQFQGELGHGR
jgi:hypothetical protein